MYLGQQEQLFTLTMSNLIVYTGTGKEQANPAKIVYVKPADSMKISSLPEDQIEEVPSTDDAHSNRYPLTFLSTSQEANPALHQQKSSRLQFSYKNKFILTKYCK